MRHKDCQYTIRIEEMKLFHFLDAIFVLDYRV